MIYIDFQGGAHGNYLEFVCNKFLGGVACNNLPFNGLGSSHNKIYYEEKKFQADHYFALRNKTKIYNSKIISIQIDYDDLLPLSSVSLLRAGDYNINNNQLEINTYHKLNNQDYRWVLDNIIINFFQTQIQDSYNAVKDQSWPNISSLKEFRNLPNWIQDECLKKHNLTFLQLDSDNPDCPRYILREFFKIGFQYPEQSGFITQQKKMIYDSSNDVKTFIFGSFYDTQNFINQVQSIGDWCQLKLQNLTDLVDLHNQFLERQPYKNSKKFCDKIIEKIYQKEIFDLSDLDVLQESYIEAQLEKLYGCNFAIDRVEWYKSSREILKRLK